MPSSAAEIEVLKFDVACALGVLGESARFPFDLPTELHRPPKAEELLSACIDPGSFTRFGCTIRTDLPSSSAYRLNVGQDELRLQPGGRIIAGGSGVTVQLFDEDLSRSYALKVPRMSVLAYDKPSLKLDERVSERFSNEYRAFQVERQLARRLSHENIAQHVFGDFKRVQRLSSDDYYPYSVSEWIEGARSLDKYLSEEQVSPIGIVDLIRQSFSALRYIHERRILHWDLKADNVLVSSSGTVKVIDFGNAKFLDDIKAPDDLIVTTTEGKYPSAAGFKPEENDAQGSRRFQIELPDISWNHPYLDLWMMGQEWNRCLDISTRFLEDVGNSLLSVRASRASRHLNDGSDARNVAECLELIFDRLLHTLSPDHIGRLQATGPAFDPSLTYYANADELLKELSRIEPLLGAGQKTPELLVSLGDIVRLPVTGNSVFTDRVAALTATSVASATKLHLQLAQVKEVYPGATHTRFEHLLGTVTTAAHFLRSLYLNEMNAFWRVSVSERDIRAVLLAAILHDAGHIAYGHFIEEMADVMDGAGHVHFIRALLKECRRYADAKDAGAENEFRPQATTFSIRRGEVVELCLVLQMHWCESDEAEMGETSDLKHLLDSVSIILGPRIASNGVTPLSRDGTRLALNLVMKSIVDGPLDADKLDYLRRDSHHSGVAYANGIDLERFFESLRVCMPHEADGAPLTAVIGVAEKGVAAVETIITARYHLFYVVYWHRTVRSITAMLQRVLHEVFLRLEDDNWLVFRRELLSNFRKSDDREALRWLRNELEKRGLRSVSIGAESLLEGELAPGAAASLEGLMAALLGDRSKYFEMAYELNYSGFATEAFRAQTSSGRLHDEISKKFHAVKPKGKRRDTRLRQTEVRLQLEQRFSDEVRALISENPLQGRVFRIDTILLDVPESDKDQIAGLYVDRRTKRNKQSSASTVKNSHVFCEFEDIRNVSPIAGALSDVFRRWARRVRVFMSKRDLARLHAFGLCPGDVAALWEKVLYDHFKLSADGQLSMPDM